MENFDGEILLLPSRVQHASRTLLLEHKKVFSQCGQYFIANLCNSCFLKNKYDL